MDARVVTQGAQCGKSDSVDTLSMSERHSESPSIRASGTFEPLVKETAATLEVKLLVKP